MEGDKLKMKRKLFYSLLLGTVVAFVAIVGEGVHAVFGATPVFTAAGYNIQSSELIVGDREIGEWSSTPEIVDWNHDGDKDIIIGDKDGYVWYYENEGTDKSPHFSTGELLQFDDETDIHVSGYAVPRVINWDNDQDFDLVIGDRYGNVYVALSTNLPTSQTPPTLDHTVSLIINGDDEGINYAAPFIYDVDVDGNKDLLVGDEEGYVWFFKNSGTDQFPAFTSGTKTILFAEALEEEEAGSATAQFLRVARHAVPYSVDWDGDGRKDLIVGELDGYITLFRGTESVAGTETAEPLPTYEQPQKIQMSLQEIDVGFHSAPAIYDWDNNGGYDLVIGEQRGYLHLFLNIHNSFAEPPEFNASQCINGEVHDLDVGHFSAPWTGNWNNDCRTDLIIGDRDGYVTIYFNSAQPDEEPIFTAPSRVKITGTVSNNSGTPTLETSDLDVGAYAVPVVYDWNNDGKKDLVLGDYLGNVTVYLNSGTDDAPLFYTSGIISLNVVGTSGTKTLDVDFYSTPFVCDWNNDGARDLLVGNGEGEVYLFLNIRTDVDPIFAEGVKLSTLTGNIDVGEHARVWVYDWNGDHKKDLLISDKDGYIWIYINTNTDDSPKFNTDERLKLNGYYLDTGNYGKLSLIDWDKNGLVDLIVGDEDGKIKVFLSSGNIDPYITKEVDKAVASTGETLTYTITYGNTGDVACQNVVITDVLDGNLGTVTEISNRGILVGNTIMWQISSLPAGSVEHKLSFTAIITGTSTSISNITTIICDELPYPLDSPPVVTQIGTSPSFEGSSKSVTPTDKVKGGDVLTYTIFYKNTGNKSATDVVIIDRIDPMLTNVTDISNGGIYINGTITWNIGIVGWNMGTIGMGYGGEVSFKATVKSPIVGGSQIKNKAMITASEIVPFETNEVVSIVVEEGSEGTDWPMFHFNPSHTGYDLSEDIEPPLKLKWSYRTGNNIYASPAVVGNRLYIGSRDKKLYCLDTDIGLVTAWGSYTTGGVVDSSPAYAAETVYFGSDDGKVYAVNTANGQLKWARTTGGAIRSSSPVVIDGVVYIGSSDRKLYALQTSDGTPLWTYETSGAINSSPAYAEGIIYFGSNDGNIYALQASDGRVNWTYTIGANVVSSPCIVDGVLYVGGVNGMVYALDTTALNDRLLWSYNVDNEINASPAYAEGILYVGAKSGYIYALNTAPYANPRLKWKYKTSGEVSSSVAMADGVAYVGSKDGKLYGINAVTGELRWSYSLDSPIHSSPAIVDGVLYIGAFDGYVYAFEPTPTFNDKTVNYKTVSPTGDVVTNTSLTYTIYYKNTGSIDAHQTRIIDYLDPNLGVPTYISSGGTYLIIGGSPTIIWNLATVFAGGGGNVGFSANAIGSNTIVTNTGLIYSLEEGTVSTNIVSNRIIDPGGVWELMGTKTIIPQGDIFIPGSEIVYTISYANCGDRLLTNVILTDKVSEIFTNVLPQCGGVYKQGTITWRLGSLKPGENGNVQYSATIKNNLPNGTLVDMQEVYIQSDQTNRQPLTALPPAILIISADFKNSIKVVNPSGEIPPGTLLSYTIHYKNTGSITATSVVITNTLDRNLKIPTEITSQGEYNQSAHAISWNLPAVAPGNDGTIGFKAEVANPLGSGTIISNDKATICCKEAESVTLSCESNKIISKPDFSYSTLEVSPQDGIGTETVLNYRLTYKNTGNMDAQNVLVTDILPDGLSMSTLTSTKEVILGPETLDLTINNGWEQFCGGVNGFIIIATNRGTFTSEEITADNYKNIQTFMDRINGDTICKVEISYASITDRFTLRCKEAEDYFVGLYESTDGGFFTQINMPTGIYCDGIYDATYRQISWQISKVGRLESGQRRVNGQVKCLVSQEIINVATITVGGESVSTNRVTSRVDVTGPISPQDNIPTEGKPDEDADIDGTYIIYWTPWKDNESGIRYYALEEQRDNESWQKLSETISPTAPSYSITGRINGHTYFYRIKAQNGADIWGTYSGRSDGIRIVDRLGLVPQNKGVTISYSNNGEIKAESTSERMSVMIPEGAFGAIGTVTVTLRKLETPDMELFEFFPQIKSILLNSTYEILALDINNTKIPEAQKAITITLPYDDPLADESQDTTYRIYWLNEPLNKWQLITGDQQVDSVVDTVAGMTFALGIHIVTEFSSELRKEDVMVRPNPFKPSVGHTSINFEGLTEKCTIWIYNLAGELVYKRYVDGSWKPGWDGKNLNGDPVASGVYIYIIRNSQGQSVAGKIAIIK